MRSAFGAGFPLFATAMYKDLGVGWASSTLAFISIAFIPIPFVLIKVRFLLASLLLLGHHTNISFTVRPNTPTKLLQARTQGLVEAMS
jgi:hypothetical protein